MRSNHFSKIIRREDQKKLNITISRTRHHTAQTKAPSVVADRVVADRVIADRYITSFSLNPIGEAWREVSAAKALKILTRMLSVSMAYNATLLDSTIATQVATQLVKQFSNGPTHYFTNTYLQQQNNALFWIPVTNSTVDSVVVVYDSQYIGMICVEDED